MPLIKRLTTLLDPLLVPLQPLVLLLARLYLAKVFIASGWLKLTNWSQTLDLFTSEYHVPVLPPMIAAVAGTFGELVFPPCWCSVSSVARRPSDSSSSMRWR